MITVLGYAAGVEEPVVRVEVSDERFIRNSVINVPPGFAMSSVFSGQLPRWSLEAPASSLLGDLWDPALWYEVRT